MRRIAVIGSGGKSTLARTFGQPLDEVVD